MSPDSSLGIMSGPSMLDILFVHNYYWQHLGIMYISAVLKQHGFTTDVAIGSEKALIEKVLKTRPKVIGFYCTTGFHHKNILTAREIKKLLGDKVITVLGGPHATFMPEIIEDKGIDIVCRGEGEYAILELMQSLLRNTDYSGIKNLVVKQNGIVHENDFRPLCDLDTLPLPDREIYRSIGPIYRLKRQEVMLGRGCYFSCSFCSDPAFRELYRGKGTYARHRSTPNMLRELEEIKSRYAPSCFSFRDDVFISENKVCSDFLEIYKKQINIPYTCLIRADQLTDRLAALLKTTGCYFVCFGVESGNALLRNKLMNKNVPETDIARCASLLHSHKIRFATFNMIGLPGESLSEAWETVDINAQIKPSWAWYSTYQPLPKTKLAEYAVEQGYINAADVTLQDATFHKDSVILRNHPEGKKMLRLKNCANLIVKMPFLKKFVGNVVLNSRLDDLYALIDNILYFKFYYLKYTYKIGFMEAVRSLYFILKNMKDQEC